eukprot:2281005-Rhodomonas_salina.2
MAKLRVLAPALRAPNPNSLCQCELGPTVQFSSYGYGSRACRAGSHRRFSESTCAVSHHDAHKLLRLRSRRLSCLAVLRGSGSGSD